MEDLISIGTIGLIKAVNTFSVERNIKLATYASRCIENEILMYLRKSAQLKNEVSLDDPLNVDWDGNELLLSDLLGSDPDTVNRDIEQEAEKQVLLEAVNRLQPREKQIMELRFGLNHRREHTQKEVADVLGISQSYISRLEKRIIERLRHDLEKVSYAKLKQLTIGYNVPKEYTKKLHIDNVRIFVTGENIFMLSNYSGLDPEVVNLHTGIDLGTQYPLARKWTIGLTVNF